MKDSAICVKTIDSIVLHGRISHVVAWMGNSREIQIIFAVNCIPERTIAFLSLSIGMMNNNVDNTELIC